MKIAVPVAAYEVGTTGEYVVRAFRKLGHEADILSQWDFYREFKKDSYDLYFCVDSGGPLNLLELEIAIRPMKKLCFWMIDYRRGKTLKNPSDARTVRLINDQGGWIFQSQYEDMVDCLNDKVTRVSWLPLAADPDVWNDKPEVEKIFDIGFVGNVWDGTRQRVLDKIKSTFHTAFVGHGGAKMEVGAALLRTARMGFNINSFFGEPIAYDVNMRVFETLSCGIPLVTNKVLSLQKLFPDAPFIRTYDRESDILNVINEACSDLAFLASGKEAREYILRQGTYEFRMKQALAALEVQKSSVRML